MSIHYVRGKAFYAKVLEPVDAYNKDGVDRGKEYTLDLSLDKDGLDLFKKKLKIGAKIKDKDNEQGEYVRFSQKEYRVDRETGEKIKNDPPRIIDAAGETWTGGKIGNESIVDVKFKFTDYGATKGVYLQGVRVLDHVPYDGDDGFAALSPDDEFFAKATVDPSKKTAAKANLGKTVLEEIDDEMPF